MGVVSSSNCARWCRLRKKKRHIRTCYHERRVRTKEPPIPDRLGSTVAASPLATGYTGAIRFRHCRLGKVAGGVDGEYRHTEGEEGDRRSATAAEVCDAGRATEGHFSGQNPQRGTVMQKRYVAPQLGVATPLCPFSFCVMLLWRAVPAPDPPPPPELVRFPTPWTSTSSRVERAHLTAVTAAQRSPALIPPARVAAQPPGRLFAVAHRSLSAGRSGC